jgi:hypothetical protein
VNDTLGSSTGAARVETDQGAAYAKLLGNPEGSQALFCEWVGTQAAAWLGLPTFAVAVVDVAAPGLVTYSDGSSSKAGPAFVARSQDGTTWGGSSKELDAVENPEVISGLVVLDTWLLNCDRYRAEAGQVRRNTRNVFLSGDGAAKGKFRLLAMDHTHCFTCGRELASSIKNIDRVQDARLYGNFPEFRPHLTHEAVSRYAASLTSFKKESADRLLHGVPPAWLPQAEIVAALAEFIEGRAGFVGQNVRKMLVDQGDLQPQLALEH